MHYATQRFWKCYNALPEAVQRVADQNYELLKADPSHPSLHCKKVVNTGLYGLGKATGHWELKSKMAFYGCGLALMPSMTSSSVNSNGVT